MFSLCFQKFRRGAERVFISDNLADDSYIFFSQSHRFSFSLFRLLALPAEQGL